jgi:AcrR family transcriptional regulator
MSAKPVSSRRAKTRERLIDAAAEAIAEKGFQAATLDEIAARAGLTKGAIYDNFESKDALFFAVVLARPVALPLPASREGPLAGRLQGMARQTLHDQDAELHMPLRAEFLLYTLGHPELRERVDAWLKAGFAEERGRVERLFGPGELPMSPQAFVVMLQAMIPGLRYLRSQSPDLVTDAVVEEIFAALGQ